MKKKTACLYPGIKEVETIKSKAFKSNMHCDPQPDFIGGKPNYSKFHAHGRNTEKTLAWLNID